MEEGKEGTYYCHAEEPIKTMMFKYHYASLAISSTNIFTKRTLFYISFLPLLHYFCLPFSNSKNVKCHFCLSHLNHPLMFFLTLTIPILFRMYFVFLINKMKREIYETVRLLVDFLIFQKPVCVGVIFKSD